MSADDCEQPATAAQGSGDPTHDLRPKPANRSLFAYFGGKPRGEDAMSAASGDEAYETASNGAAASSAGTSAKQPPRKRRKKVDEGQARLMKAEGGGWALGRAQAAGRSDVDVAEAPSVGMDADTEQVAAATPADTAKRKPAQGKRKEEGEDAEVKEMAQRTRKTMAKRGIRRGPADSRVVGTGATVGTSGSQNGSLRSPSRSTSPSKPNTRSNQNVHRSSNHNSQAGPSRHTSPPIIHLSSDGPDEEDLTITGMKNGHLRNPFIAMSRVNSASSKGTSHRDVIDVDEHDHDAPVVLDVKHKQPRKLVFAADQRTAHSFFNRSPALAAASPVHSVMASSDAVGESDLGAGPPIGVAISQSSQGQAKKAAATTSAHPFFSGGSRPEPGKLKTGWGGGVKEGEEWSAPLPGRIWPGNVGLPATTGESSTSRLRRRSLQRVSPADKDEHWRNWSANTASHRRHTAAPRTAAATLPAAESGSSLPAIQSVRKRQPGPNRASWCEKYRPLTARQVLGNETESVYLRDWLKALAVGHEQRIKITRRVPRTRSALLDGWIVDDIAGFSDDGEADDADGGPEVEPFETIYTAPLPFDARPAAYPSFRTRLSNTMLLAGPHGCGKSAAVYAAAEELGWEVFEVYPGIGKRTGGALMNLVGDVGKNHIVAQTKSPGKPKPAINTFFGNGAKRDTGHTAKKRRVQDDEVVFLSSSQGSQKDPIDFLSDPQEEDEAQDAAEKGFKQSLILLDEADLLYEEESTFWPAVISLIAESRRPVILTCNDSERIPISSLPLQAILQYRPAPASEAIPYLSAIAKQEQLDLDHDRVAQLYQRCLLIAPDLLDQPLPPNGHEAVPTFDLRRAISQMQLERSSALDLGFAGSLTNGHFADVEHELASVSIDSVARASNYRSYCDAHVQVRAAHMIEMNEIDRYTPTADDLLGVAALRKPTYNDRYPSLASIAFEHAKDMSDELLYFSADVDGSLPAAEADGRLQEARIKHIRSLLPLLDPLIPLGAPLLPAACLFTDYLPAIRSIVLADDVLQAADQAADERGEERINRRTGRPVRITDALKREEYRRYLAPAGVDREGEDVVRHLAFGEA